MMGACEKDEPAPTLSVSTHTFTFDQTGKIVETDQLEGYINVRSNTKWTVTLDDASTWCTLSKTSGEFVSSIKVKAEANLQITKRETTITIQAGSLQEKVTVIQKAGDAALSITPTLIYPETNAASSHSINVTSNVAWTAEIAYISEQGWCTFEPASGSGNGVITVNLLQNPNSRRSAIITIKSGDLMEIGTIVQHGVPSTEVGVTINGITWATRNVDGFGAFADLSSSAGKYYKFNRTVGYNYIGGHTEFVSYDSAIVGGEVNPTFDTERTNENSDWLLINDPSPEGWRLPTDVELENLRTSGYKWVAADNGAWFGPNASNATFTVPGNAVFFPAAGLLLDDKIYYKNEGRYYTKTQGWHGDEGRALIFNNSFTREVTGTFHNKVCALLIRCVKE
ncbi:hypothetical protein FACS1894199_14930 [Bacteroidia bacterium]|nr:hypothetical protein FACS1894199_14930 [Bacteroidia bacterium]